MKKYKVTLTVDERKSLPELMAGKGAATKQTQARILLQAAAAPGGPAWTDARSAEALAVHVTTVESRRERFVEQGLDAARGRTKQDRPSRPRRLDGQAEARLSAGACSEPPPGRARWTWRLLADQLVELEIVDTVSTATVRRTLKKTSSSRGGRSRGAFRPRPTPRSSVRREDVLAVYHRPDADKRPLVCWDEASQQRIGAPRPPVPAQPGPPERCDDADERHGTGNLFLISEPLWGWRTVRGTERRTAQDLAEVRRWLVADLHPEAAMVVVVLDNLNTPQLASLYARRCRRSKRGAARRSWRFSTRPSTAAG